MCCREGRLIVIPPDNYRDRIQFLFVVGFCKTPEGAEIRNILPKNRYTDKTIVELEQGA